MSMSNRVPVAPEHRRYLPDGYRKREVYVEEAKAGARVRVDSYWDGGSRDYYTLYRNGVGRPVASGNCGIGHFNPEDKLELLAGDVLVRTGVFCGKTSCATLTFVKGGE